MPLRNPLSPLECKQIVRLRKSGLGINKIAKSMHRGKVTVKRFLENSADGTELLKNVNKYKELKGATTTTGTPKSKETKTLIRVDYKKSTEKEKIDSKTSPDDEEAAYKKVSLEHRAVIKFLTKEGQTIKQIHTSMQRVYGNSVPSLLAITYWSTQFKTGRESINEIKPKIAQPTSKPSAAKILVKKFANEKIWIATKKSETKISNSTPNKMKASMTLPLKKSLSSSQVKKNSNDKRFTNNAKKLITIKFPTHKKLREMRD